MEKDNTVSGADVSTPHLAEDTMEPMMVEPVNRTTPKNPCTHSRAIDDVLTKTRKRTGQVRCLECGAIFDDPSLEQA